MSELLNILSACSWNEDIAIPLLQAIPREEPEFAEAKRLIALLQYFEGFDTMT